MNTSSVFNNEKGIAFASKYFQSFHNIIKTES